MPTTRKHLMSFQCLINIHVNDVERVQRAVADRPRSTLELQDWSDEPDAQGWITYYVVYGPVRGANKHDITKFMDRLEVPYALSQWTDTEFECDCTFIPGSCTAETAAYV